MNPAEDFSYFNPPSPPAWISRVFDPPPPSLENFQNPIQRGGVDFSGTTQYTRMVVADLGKGPRGRAPYLWYKKQRGGQYNGNAASESMLVYTYVSSPAKESTFQWGQIQTPQMPLSFYLFSACNLHFMICAVYFVLLTHWFQWSFLPKTLFLDILEIFGLDIGQSSFNLVKKASATWQPAFLPLASRFTTFWLRHA